MAENPARFIGLDIHKEYFVAVGVNAEREVVFGPQRGHPSLADHYPGPAGSYPVELAGNPKFHMGRECHCTDWP
jgi:hypothetical protein